MCSDGKFLVLVEYVTSGSHSRSIRKSSWVRLRLIRWPRVTWVVCIFWLPPGPVGGAHPLTCGEAAATRAARMYTVMSTGDRWFLPFRPCGSGDTVPSSAWLVPHGFCALVGRRAGKVGGAVSGPGQPAGRASVLSQGKPPHLLALACSFIRTKWEQ